MVTTIPCVKGALISEAPRGPPVWELCVGVPHPAPSEGDALFLSCFLLALLGFSSMQHTGKSNLMFIPFIRCIVSLETL